jgi:hypothetical protein
LRKVAAVAPVFRAEPIAPTSLQAPSRFGGELFVLPATTLSIALLVPPGRFAAHKYAIAQRLAVVIRSAFVLFLANAVSHLVRNRQVDQGCPNQAKPLQKFLVARC